jgi:DNA-binding MarR family transcriptional regulator
MEEVKEGLVEKEISIHDNLLAENDSLKEEITSLRQELLEIKSIISSQIPTNSQTNVFGFPTDSPSKTSSFPLFSTGNEGVPTDRQTDAQQTGLPSLEMINSLRADLKIKFRNLTRQEFKVFCAVYILEQQQPVDYRAIAEKLRLSESSIRDYIMKMEKKGIPISKEKINNKKILLHVHSELRELIPLEAIMKIREPIFR